MSAMSMDFVSFYDYSVGSWKYSDSGIFLFSYQIISQVYRFLNSDLFLIEDTKKNQYVYLRGYRGQDKRYNCCVSLHMLIPLQW